MADMFEQILETTSKDALDHPTCEPGCQIIRFMTRLLLESSCFKVIF